MIPGQKLLLTEPSQYSEGLFSWLWLAGWQLTRISKRQGPQSKRSTRLPSLPGLLPLSYSGKVLLQPEYLVPFLGELLFLLQEQLEISFPSIIFLFIIEDCVLSGELHMHSHTHTQ